MTKQIVTIAGAGSGHTPGVVLTMLDQEDFLVKELRLYDNDVEKNKDMEVIIEYLLKRDNLDVKLVRTEDAKEAFTDVDFIFTQIRVGKMEMREKDEKIPLKHGIVGQETCGLGGFAYGMRSMKGFLKLVGDIIKYAPEAWILNYTNPETIIAEAVRREYPEAKIINACDMTIGIEEIMANSFGYSRDNWIPYYYGLNHFGWYESIYDISLGRDIMPELIEKITNNGFEVEGYADSWAQTYRNMELITKNFPTHIPNNYLEYYLYPDTVVEQENKNYTRANEIMNGRLKELKENVRRIQKNEDLDKVNYKSSGHGQYIVDIAVSILNNKNDRFMLIVPNKGSIPNLREDAVVEVPCYVNKFGVDPISLRSDIPDFHKGLMEAQVASEKLLVDAYFKQSYQTALEAFTLNQTVPNANVAKKVLDDLIEANKGYWVPLN